MLQKSSISKYQVIGFSQMNMNRKLHDHSVIFITQLYFVCYKYRYSAVHSKVVVLLLLIHCLLLLLMFVKALCLILVLLFSSLCPSSFAIILSRKRELVP